MARRFGTSAAIALGLPRDRRFYLGSMASALQALSAVALLATSGWLISRAAEQPPVMYLMVGTVGVRAFALGRAAFRYAERILLHDASFRLQAELRPRIFEALVPFAPSGLRSKHHGDNISTLVSDVDELQGLSIRVLSPLIQAVSVSIAAFVFCWMMEPGAALALAATIIGAFLIAFPISARIGRKSDEQVSETRAKLHTQTLELVENLDVYIAFDWIEQKLESIGSVDRHLSKISLRNGWAAGIGQALVSIFSLAATIAVAFIAASEVASGRLAGVALAVFALLPIAVFDVLNSAHLTISAWRRYEKSAIRVNSVLQAQLPPELSVDDSAVTQTSLERLDSLKLVSLDAIYPGASEPALTNCNLEILAGDRILLEGPSGSGKTTVARVLLRMLSPSSGKYLINGRDASEFSADSIRRKVGLVEQNPTIFMGTVRANLALAKPSAGDDELLAVLERVGLSKTFSARGGLDAPVGERGLMISGGEAQRLALARALLADFAVIIFDEPTSNVDRPLAKNLLIDLLKIASDEGANGSPKRAIVVISHDRDIKDLFNKQLKFGT